MKFHTIPEKAEKLGVGIKITKWEAEKRRNGNAEKSTKWSFLLI